MRIIAKEAFPYNGQNYLAGDVIETASERDGELLVMIGKAVKPGDETAPPVKRGPGRPRKYDRRDLVASEE
jgi:hypothetical protein